MCNRLATLRHQNICQHWGFYICLSFLAFFKFQLLHDLDGLNIVVPFCLFVGLSVFAFWPPYAIYSMCYLKKIRMIKKTVFVIASKVQKVTEFTD